MGMWQDNSLKRITDLEDRLQDQARLICELSDLLIDVTTMVYHQAVKEDSSYVNRGQQY